MDPLPQLTLRNQSGDPGQLDACPDLRQQAGADMLENHIQRDSKVKEKRCLCFLMLCQFNRFLKKTAPVTEAQQKVAMSMVSLEK
ncbi:unnamed protein product [Gadus morhua 'NCC']